MGSVCEMLDAEGDHEVMLVGEALQPQPGGSGGFDEAVEVHMRGEIDLAGARERVGLAAVGGVCGERACGAGGRVVFVPRIAVVHCEHKPALHRRRDFADPRSGGEIHLRRVALRQRPGNARTGVAQFARRNFAVRKHKQPVLRGDHALAPRAARPFHNMHGKRIRQLI